MGSGANLCGSPLPLPSRATVLDWCQLINAGPCFRVVESPYPGFPPSRFLDVQLILLPSFFFFYFGLSLSLFLFEQESSLNIFALNLSFTVAGNKCLGTRLAVLPWPHHLPSSKRRPPPVMVWKLKPEEMRACFLLFSVHADLFDQKPQGGF